MAIVHISYSRDNITHLGRVLELARRLQGAGIETRLHELRDAGQAADIPEPAWLHNPAEGPLLVVWSPAYAALTAGPDTGDTSSAARHWFGAEVSAVAVLFDPAHADLLPAPLTRRKPYVISTETDFQHLLSDLRGGGLNPVRPAMAARPADQGNGAARARPEQTASVGAPRPIQLPTQPMPAGRPATQPWSGKLARLQSTLRSVFSRGPTAAESSPTAAAPPPMRGDHDDDTWPGAPLEQGAPVSAAAEPPEAPAAAAAPPAEAEPVWFGATSPRRAVPGDQLTAALAVYIESRRQSAQDKLAAFGEPGDRQLLDLAPDGDACWALGAPVTVTLSGRHVSVRPPRREFLWNGKENLAAFEVSVAPDAPPGKVTLTFQVALAGVPMAFVPMAMEIGAPGARPELKPEAIEQQQRAPRSAFASYSSADAAEVTGRLSTLQRWSPTLAIFQDCLDLQPNEAFKAQLEHEIASRDVFLLFWSTHAAASQWVRWEYDQARSAKGLDAIVPMPLQDPSIAHPPPEFETAHLRDRFMMAGYALQAIRQQATTMPPP